MPGQVRRVTNKCRFSYSGLQKNACSSEEVNTRMPGQLRRLTNKVMLCQEGYKTMQGKMGGLQIMPAYVRKVTKTCHIGVKK
jgi:hypothetical protein